PGKVAINTTSGFVRFLDGVGYTVDTVTPAAGDPCFTATVTGVKTGASNVDNGLVNQAGALTLAQTVSAGTGTVRVTSATAVTQTAGGAGAVTGANVAGLATASVDLCEVANAVPGKVAINTTSGFVRFLDSVGYTVDTVLPAAGDPCFTATVTGVK